MNSPNSDSLLDSMFREALQPEAQATPPVDAWEQISQALPAASVKLQLLSQAESPSSYAAFRLWVSNLLSGLLFWRTPVWRVPRWRKVVSLVHGFETVYPPSTSSLVCLEPDGRCLPSPFAGVMVKQVLDLRLAS